MRREAWREARIRIRTRAGVLLSQEFRHASCITGAITHHASRITHHVSSKYSHWIRYTFIDHERVSAQMFPSFPCFPRRRFEARGLLRTSVSRAVSQSISRAVSRGKSVGSIEWSVSQSREQSVSLESSRSKFRSQSVSQSVSRAISQS